MSKPSNPNHADNSWKAPGHLLPLTQLIKGLVASPGYQKKFWTKDLLAEKAPKEMLKMMKIPRDPRGTGHIHMEGGSTAYLPN